MSDCTLHKSQLYFGGEFFMIRRLRFGMNTVSRRPKTIASTVDCKLRQHQRI